jgi:hypothetical protein
LLDSAYGAYPDTGYYQMGITNRIYVVQSYGGDVNDNKDTANIYLNLSRINRPVVEGNYFAFGHELGVYDFQGIVTYQFNNRPPSNDTLKYFGLNPYDLPSFKIQVTHYDPISRLIEGVFSGPIYKIQHFGDNSGNLVTITNGKFRTYLANK